MDRQEEAADEQRRNERRNLTTWIDDDGMVVVRGRLSPEVGAVVRRALEAAGDRLRANVSPEEAAETSFGQRQADALGLIAESALAADLDRGTAGDRYQVVLHVEAESLRADADGQVPDCSVEMSAADVAANGRGNDEPLGNRDVSAGASLHDDRADGDEGTRCSGARSVSADTLPNDERAGDEARIGCRGGSSVSAETPSRLLADGHAALEDADGLRVSPETGRRLACDAGAVVMRHAADGTVLDVGRKTRTIPPALRRALLARDRQCRFPGCNARRCDAHHIRHWADGGPTRLDNLVLLCRRHHRAVHEEGFSVRMDPSGDAAFRWPDGRPFPHVPAAPWWTGPPLAPTEARLAVADIEIGPDTATPDWHGERLDLVYAIDVLWTPRTGSGTAADGAQA